jgi:hypothetical protein
MMKFISFLAVIFGCASIAFAQPTTMPDPSMVRPPLKVLVAPLGQVGGNNLGWIGKAFDEELSIDAGLDSGMIVISATRGVTSTEQATIAGKNAGATLVIFGSYQYYAGNLRVNAEILDVLNGRVLAILGTSGPLADLEKIENAVSTQLSDALPQEAGVQMPIAANIPMSQPPYGYVAPPGYGYPYPGNPYPGYAYPPDYENYGPMMNNAYPVPPIYGSGGDAFFGSGFYGGGGFHGGYHGGFHGGGFHGGFHGSGFHGGRGR